MQLEKFSDEWLDHIFTYHAPTPGQPAQYEAIRQAGRALAKTILENAPPCADTTVAIRRVREALFIANGAIATGGAG